MAQLKYDRGVLAKKQIKELQTLCKEEDIEYKGREKKDMIADLAAIEVSDEDELDDEELDDELDDEELDDDEVDDIDDDEPAPKKSKASKSKKPAASGETLAAKQVATILGTEAKTLRQFFRSPASTIEPVGSGGRYEFDKSDLPTIEKEFKAWKEGHAARGSKRTSGGGKAAKAKAEVDAIEEVEEIEELDEDELDDEIDDDDLELDDEDE